MKYKFELNKGYIAHSNKSWNIPFTNKGIEFDIDNKHKGALSHIREEQLVYIFSNLIRKENNSKYDFDDIDNGNKYECRNVGSNNEADLKPSYMKGKGRKFSQEEYEEKLNEVNAFIIIKTYNKCKDLVIVPILPSAIIEESIKLEKCISSLSLAFISKYIGKSLDLVVKKLLNQASINDEIIIFDIPIK